jgi:VanZ family protein
MGFVETYGHILSYFGIGLLGLGILVSIFGIISACYWLFTSVSNTQGPVISRRLLVVLAVIAVSSSYLGSPSFYEVMGWWKTTIFGTFILGFMAPILRTDLVRLERRADRGIAMIAGIWWSILVFSEALLVSGAPNQAIVLYLFAAVAGIFAGSTLGVTVARTARMKMAGPAEASGTP